MALTISHKTKLTNPLQAPSFLYPTRSSWQKGRADPTWGLGLGRNLPPHHRQWPPLLTSGTRHFLKALPTSWTRLTASSPNPDWPSSASSVALGKSPFPPQQGMNFWTAPPLGALEILEGRAPCHSHCPSGPQL